MTWTYSNSLHSYTLTRDGKPIAWAVETEHGWQSDLGNGRIIGTYSTPAEAQQAAERQLEDEMQHETEHTLELQDGEPMDDADGGDLDEETDETTGMEMLTEDVLKAIASDDEPEPTPPPKKTRKTRSDKNKPRGPRKAKPEAPAPVKAKRGRKGKKAGVVVLPDVVTRVWRVVEMVNEGRAHAAIERANAEEAIRLADSYESEANALLDSLSDEEKQLYVSLEQANLMEHGK
jgi:hypothetical protein